MGSMLAVQLVNGLDGDPAVFAYLPQGGEAVLFDAGELDQLSNRELLKIRTVCISHTHVDHFIGFDRLLRVNVPHFRTLEVIGPTGIIANICGKLASYAWNLLQPDQVNFIVHEVEHAGAVRSVKISNTNNFLPVPMSLMSSSGAVTPTAVIPLSHDRYEIHAITLDHGMDVCGFVLRLPSVVSVSKQALDQLGLEPGPWIGELQRMATQDELSGELETSPGTAHDAKTLAEQILTPRAGESVAYVTDIVFSEENLDRMVHTLSNVDTLVCETNYRHEHQSRAFEKKHLTTKQASLIAAAIRAKNLKIFHVSNIYGGNAVESELEAQNFFDELTTKGEGFLRSSLAEEFEGFHQFSK